MKGREIDNLLEAYLRPDESEEGEAEDPPRPQVDARPAPEPEPSEQRAQPAAPAAVDTAPAKPELRGLLARYLDTFPGDGDDSAREFALPRSAEIDELLRRYVVDNEDVANELSASLRNHFEAGTRADRAADAGSQWAQLAVATQQELLPFDDRLERYAQAYAELDDRSHTFTADDSTIKGVPPPNAPPIPVGSPMARRLQNTPPSGLKKER